MTRNGGFRPASGRSPTNQGLDLGLQPLDTEAMKRFLRIPALILVLAASTASFTAVTMLTGCVNNDNGDSVPDIQRISAAVEEAARFGTSEAVRDNPTWRPTFALVRDELMKLSLKDKLTVADLLDAVAKLPVSELSSDTARVIIAGARLTIALANWSDVEIVQTEQIRPVVVALAGGINGGLIESPASKPQAAKKHYKVK